MSSVFPTSTPADPSVKAVAVVCTVETALDKTAWVVQMMMPVVRVNSVLQAPPLYKRTVAPAMIASRVNTPTPSRLTTTLHCVQRIVCVSLPQIVPVI